MSILQRLSTEDLRKVREAIIKNQRPRISRYFSGDDAFGTKENFRKKIAELSLERLARVIKICGFLLQTKIYLFWDSRKNGGKSDSC